MAATAPTASNWVDYSRICLAELPHGRLEADWSLLVRACAGLLSFLHRFIFWENPDSAKRRDRDRTGVTRSPSNGAYDANDFKRSHLPLRLLSSCARSGPCPCRHDWRVTHLARRGLAREGRGGTWYFINRFDRHRGTCKPLATFSGTKKPPHLKRPADD